MKKYWAWAFTPKKYSHWITKMSIVTKKNKCNFLPFLVSVVNFSTEKKERKIMSCCSPL